MTTKAKRSRLIDLDDPEYVQQNLFLHPSVNQESEAIWPPIERTEEGFLKVVEQADREGYMGADLEFSRSGRPTILGVACSDRCASLPWDAGLARVAFRSRTTKYVGHFVLDADKPKIEATLGVKIPVNRWDSTELRHYILNSDFTSMPGKSEDDEDSNSLGLMNIWVVLSLYTSLPNYKLCRNSACIGPCPRHDVYGYNAIDAFGPVGANHRMIAEMRRRDIPEKLYDDLKDLTLMCDAMTAKGVWVDRTYVKTLEEMWEAEKAAMFPYELRRKGGKEVKVYGTYEGESWVPLPFAPTAPQQAIRYFEDHGMSLRGKGGKVQADKATVRKLLERKLREAGVDYEVSRFGGVELVEGEVLDKLPIEVQWLFKLDCHKSTGKGLDSWFADDYFVDPQGRKTDGFLHPRFIVTGTVTGRLSSSRPNCFDAETEVLTRTGWVALPQLTAEQEVVEWRPDGSLAFTIPTALYQRDYTGRMIELNNQHISLRVTEDHRCLVVKRKSGEPHVYAARDYPTDHHQLNSGILIDETQFADLKDNEIRFLVAVQADGSLAYKDSIDFSFHKERKAKRLKALLDALDADYEVLHNSQRFRYRVRDADLWNLVMHYLGGEKTFGWWPLSMSQHQRTLFFNELFFWDGNYTTRRNYASAIKKNADVVQAVGTSLGHRVKNVVYVNNSGSTSYQCYVTYNCRYSGTANIDRREEHVTERVYCLSVPSSYVLVRRRGCTMITGQCQNIPKSGKRALVRRAFKPRHKGLKFLVSDKSNLELRVVLNYAGTKLEIPDAFSWLVSKSEGAFSEAAAQAGRGERDVAKRVSHAGSLLEGVKVYYDEDLRSTKVRSEIKDGAIVLFDGVHKSPKWEYRGGFIGFTGANLAEGLFKSKTNEARRRALAVQEKYFGQFPQIRELQRSWSRQAEKGWVRTRSGRYVELYNNPEDDLKLCAAMFMQGGGADEVQECMRRFWYRGGEYDVPVLQIHDELVFEVPGDWTDDQYIAFMEPFYHPSDLFGGQIFPVEISVGTSWFGGIKGLDAGDRRTIFEKGHKC